MSYLIKDPERYIFAYVDHDTINHNLLSLVSSKDATRFKTYEAAMEELLRLKMIFKEQLIVTKAT